MKAFRDDKDNIILFRPDCNMHRLKNACNKVALPVIKK